jgi:hypothetical protein
MSNGCGGDAAKNSGANCLRSDGERKEEVENELTSRAPLPF